MSRFARYALVTMSALALVGCGSAKSGFDAATAPSTAPAPATAAATPSATTSAAAAQAAPVPSSNAAAAEVGPWTMPNLVGRNLQEAQDAIQALTDYGIPITYSSDATGKGRSQLSDRNWKVCAQNVKAGASITSKTRIEFAAAKLDERC